MQPNNKTTLMQEAFEHFIAQQSGAIKATYARIKPTFSWHTPNPIGEMLKAAGQIGAFAFGELLIEYGQRQTESMQEAFEHFIAQQSEAIKATYARIKPTFSWHKPNPMGKMLEAAGQIRAFDFSQLLVKYGRHQTELAQTSLEQLITKQSPELRLYYEQLKAKAQIYWGYGIDVIQVGVRQAIIDNNLAFIRLVLTQYRWAQYYQLDSFATCLLLATTHNHQEIIQFFFNEFDWRYWMTPARLIMGVSNVLNLLVLHVYRDEHNEHNSCEYYDKKKFTQAAEFLIDSFIYNPQMFGYSSDNDLVAEYCRSYVLCGRLDQATEALAAICMKLDSIASRRFLKLLAKHVDNIKVNIKVSASDLQKLHTILDGALATLDQKLATITHKHEVTEQQFLQQQSRDTQVAGNQKGAAIATRITQLEDMIFKLLIANLPPHIKREQLLQQILVGHAAVLQQCLDQYSASHQNFVTSQGKLEQVIANSKQVTKPQFIVLDNNCAAFNLDSRAILIVAPPRIANDPYQVWYFSPTGAAMPEVVQEVIQRQLGMVNISIIPNQAAAAQVATQQKLGQ